MGQDRWVFSQHMGRRNYLIEGLSGTGKTSVCDELQRRGHHAIHGDRELAYRGDPETGEPMEGFGHEHHIWDVARSSSSSTTWTTEEFRADARMRP
jgi:broad-specificity NMP kinase